MPETLFPLFAFAALVASGALLGIVPIRKLIKIQEAKHELKQGSAGYLRTIAGWSIIAIWIVALWFFATITGDWWATQDLDGAMARSGKRLEVIIQLMAILASD